MEVSQAAVICGLIFPFFSSQILSCVFHPAMVVCMPAISGIPSSLLCLSILSPRLPIGSHLFGALLLLSVYSWCRIYV
jgi:hypothetical protein